jgi:hypothetical protein
MFEYVGNAWLQDANAPRRAVVRKTTFDTCYFQWAEASRLARAPRDAIWDFERAEHIRWLQPKEPFALLPGAAALLKVAHAEGCEIRGHVGHLSWNCAQHGKPLLDPATVRDDSFRGWELSEPGGWSGGFVAVAEDSPAVTPSEVLEWAPGGRVRRGRPGPAPVAGLCQMGAPPGGLAIAATSGRALGVRAPEGRADAWLAKGPDGTGVPGPREGAIGWCFYLQDGEAIVALS